MEGLGKKLGWINWIVTGAGVAMGVGMLTIYDKRLPPQVPLWYSRPWGEEQLVSPAWLWVVVGLIAICGVAGGVFFKKGVLADMLVAGGIATQVLLAIAMLKIVLLTI